MSRLPGLVGLCQTDVAGVGAVVNAAQERIAYAREVGDPGWWKAWAEINFEVSQSDPVFVAPRDVDRIISTDICTWPVPVQNQFFEYLRWGWGHWPKVNCTATSASGNNSKCAPLVVLDRGITPTFSPFIGNQKVAVYPTDDGDIGMRVLVQGKDANGIPVRTLDGLVQVEGEFVELTSPFAVTVNTYSTISGLQKDVTLGRVNLFMLDPDTGDQASLSFMEPGELTAAYRRYFLSGLPRNCCSVTGAMTTADTVQVTALVQLALLPVVAPTDYLTVQSVEALTHEAQSIRYDSIDLPNAKQMADYHHRAAIRLLQGQLVHNTGKLNPAVVFAPFGDARLERQGIGLII